MNNVDILPRWEHPHFKPNCSRRQDKEYYLEDITGETISSPYLFSNIEGDRELVEGRGRSKLSGKVGEEIRRLEGGRVGGGKRKQGEGEGYDNGCISWTEGGGGGGRRRRKGGRISKLLKLSSKGKNRRTK